MQIEFDPASFHFLILESFVVYFFMFTCPSSFHYLFFLENYSWVQCFLRYSRFHTHPDMKVKLGPGMVRVLRHRQQQKIIRFLNRGSWESTLLDAEMDDGFLEQILKKRKAQNLTRQHVIWIWPQWHMFDFLQQ